MYSIRLLRQLPTTGSVLLSSPSTIWKSKNFFLLLFYFFVSIFVGCFEWILKIRLSHLGLLAKITVSSSRTIYCNSGSNLNFVRTLGVSLCISAIKLPLLYRYFSQTHELTILFVYMLPLQDCYLHFKQITNRAFLPLWELRETWQRNWFFKWNLSM